MEIRVHLRQVVVLVAVLVILMIIFMPRTQKCFMPEFLLSASEYNKLPIIYAITPTYTRPVQKAELTRLSQTLMLVPFLHWIIIEDANASSNLVVNLIRRKGLDIRTTILATKTPTDFKLKIKDPHWLKPRGVEQRNAGLEWIRKNAPKDKHAIVYFMDDDNTYSLELFEEMTRIEPGRVGVWPVGLVGGLKAEKPLMDSNKRVTGFNSMWRPERPFPVDMAGFGISIDLLLKRPEAVFSYDVQRGYQESELLRHLTTIDDLQPMANLCREVLVWHTRTENPKFEDEEKLIKKGIRSDEGLEV